MPRLEFWYEFASTYSYLSALRIEPLATRAGVEIAWRPFLLGPIFKAQGWTTSPFNLYPAKGRYMIRDIERIAAARGLVFHMPEPFPANGLTAARLALVGADEGWAGAFTRSVYLAEFAQHRDISDKTVLSAIADDLGLDFARLSGLIDSPNVKQKLKDQSEKAAALGLFGAPTFRSPDGEIFWGDDRLEQALEWSLRL